MTMNMDIEMFIADKPVQPGRVRASVLESVAVEKNWESDRF